MPKNSQRMTRINDEIARAVANIVRFEMSDPRICKVVSVTGANTTSDLKFCKISVSVLEQEGPQEEEAQKIMEVLSKASGFVRKRIAENINLRHTPQITFVLDDRIAHAMRMNRIIDEVAKHDS